MKNTLSSAVLAGWMMMNGIGTVAKAQSEQSAAARQEIVMHIYNYAQVGPTVLRSAEAIVAQIFHKAGIEAVMVEYDGVSSTLKSAAAAAVRASRSSS